MSWEDRFGDWRVSRMQAQIDALKQGSRPESMIHIQSLRREIERIKAPFDLRYFLIALMLGVLAVICVPIIGLSVLISAYR
jgi:hypothetical protein